MWRHQAHRIIEAGPGASSGSLLRGGLPAWACAIGGSIWFAKNRSDLANVPPVTRALAWIGLGAAIGQTILFIVLFVLFPMFAG